MSTNEHRDLLGRLLAIAGDYLEENRAPGTPVVEFHDGTALRERVDLALGEEGVGLDELLPLIEDYLRYSVRTGHPQFLNQLYAGFNAAGFAGDLVASLTNTSMYTYEVAPVATLVELTLIEKMNGLLGFVNGEGIFCTGGSNANMLGLLCARDRAFPEVKARGHRDGERPVLFVSDQAHYSFVNAANVLGLGQENLIRVRTDANGRMMPRELDQAVERSKAGGETPFFVGATAGTTVTGAFDPLEEIAEVCARQGLWLHVDGSWGGPVILSPKHRHLLAGVERADSIAWDAHKSMGATLTCSAFLTRHRGRLRRACSADSGAREYLFHGGESSCLDLGTASLQCGRRVDALRLWLIWKQFGDHGLAARVDRTFELARAARDRVEMHPDLELMAPVESLNICFRYLPGGGDEPNAFNLELRERMRKSGKAFVNYAYLGGALALRLVIANPELRDADLAAFFDELLATAEALSTARSVGARRRPGARRRSASVVRPPQPAE